MARTIRSMRLAEHERALLRAAARRHFGAEARIWLFGSRVDAARRGGDIDVMVKTPLAAADALIDARLAFLAELHATPAFEGEKIDVVLWSPAFEDAGREIRAVAQAEGVEL